MFMVNCGRFGEYAWKLMEMYATVFYQPWVEFISDNRYVHQFRLEIR